MKLLPHTAVVDAIESFRSYYGAGISGQLCDKILAAITTERLAKTLRGVQFDKDKVCISCGCWECPDSCQIAAALAQYESERAAGEARGGWNVALADEAFEEARRRYPEANDALMFLHIAIGPSTQTPNAADLAWAQERLAASPTPPAIAPAVVGEELAMFACDLAAAQKPMPPDVAKAIADGWDTLFDEPASPALPTVGAGEVVDALNRVVVHPLHHFGDVITDAYVCRAKDWQIIRSAALTYSAPANAKAGDALSMALRFHEAYERLAPSFGYETRDDTKAFDPASKNGRLMVAVCAELMPHAIQGDSITPTMLEAARDWSAAKYGISIGNDAAEGCYRAMRSAALAHPVAAQEGG